MLDSLYIKNFAIIDAVSIDFNNQFTVLTGETGAGKSIIIQSIGQLCGNRGNVDYIKKGKDLLLIEGIFTVSDEILDLLDEYDIPHDSNELVISKTIRKDGKTIIKMNYKNVTLTVLKKIAPHLIDIHSQFETHQLFEPASHIELLDRYIGKEIEDLKKQYADAFKKLNTLNRQYSNLINEAMSDEQLDFYQSQLDEINSIDFDHFDEDQLIKERKRMLDHEKNQQHYQLFNQYMNGNQGLLSLFQDCLSELSYIEDEEISKIYDALYDIYYTINDHYINISTIESQSEFDEDYYQELQDQYFTFNKLKRKYGQTVESILKFKEELTEKIDHFNNRDTLIMDLQQQLSSAQKEAEDIASKMSALRKEKAAVLENKIMDILAKLYLPHIKLQFVFEKTNNLSANGKDIVIINVATNVNSELKPLYRIASGGELSRIMLAIKTASQQTAKNDTIIFDEADTGVSGKVAESIGKIMKEISKNQQVLCITHLAQVASFANHHLYIEKTDDDSDTHVNVTVLDEQKSIEEIAKMISGKDVTKESLEHARHLKKQSLKA